MIWLALAVGLTMVMVALGSWVGPLVGWVLFGLYTAAIYWKYRGA